MQIVEDGALTDTSGSGTITSPTKGKGQSGATNIPPRPYTLQWYEAQPAFWECAWHSEVYDQWDWYVWRDEGGYKFGAEKPDSKIVAKFQCGFLVESIFGDTQ